MKRSKLFIPVCAFGLMVFLFAGHVPSVWAKKAAFKAGVSPTQLNLRIVSGQVQGNVNSRVKIERIQRSKTFSCNKIKQIWMVDTHGNVLDQFRLNGRGLCYFEKDHAIIRTLQPFSINELKGVCANSASRTLIKNVAVNAYNVAWDVTRQDSYGNRRTPTNTANIKFQAKVDCMISASSPVRQQVPPPTTCNLSNWWSFQETGGANNDQWLFTRSGVSGTQYAAKGPGRYVRRNLQDVLQFGNGRANAQIGSNGTFSMRLNNGETCKGRINKACTQITGQCRSAQGKVKIFTLRKSKGPAPLRIKPDPTTRPVTTYGGVPQRKATQVPIKTVTPGPPVPPHW